MRTQLLQSAAAAILFVSHASASFATTWIVDTKNKVFVPANLTIQPGDVVRWVWVDGIHTTTSGAGGPDGLWDAPIDGSNTFFEHTFATPGDFPYFCRFHLIEGMSGTITVSAASNVPPVVQNPGIQHGLEGQYFSLILTATDADDDSLTMSVLGATPVWASFLDEGGGTALLSGTPQSGQGGNYPVSVRAFDGTASDTATFSIVIGPALAVVNVGSAGFTPGAVTIPVGGQVRWVRQGGNHTTTNGTGPLDPAAGTLWDAELRATSPEFMQAFPGSGQFPYFCRSHPSETGTVNVQGAQIGIGDSVTRRLPLAASPNPFSARVDLAFELDRATRATIRIIDLQGRTVLDLFTDELAEGSHRVTWGGWDGHHAPVASGIYFARLDTGDGQVVVRKLFKTR